MTGATKRNVPELAGSQDAEGKTNFNDDGITAPMKPEIDLASWAALGGTAKPSRTDRRQKRGWKRGQR